MSIVITGASGKLGRRVAELVLEQTSDVILATRSPEALSGLGADVRRADFDDPASLDAAFAGGSRLLLVSLPTIGARVPQQIAAVDAAVRAGVAPHLVHVDRQPGAGEPRGGRGRAPPDRGGDPGQRARVDVPAQQHLRRPAADAARRPRWRPGSS